MGGSVSTQVTFDPQTDRLDEVLVQDAGQILEHRQFGYYDDDAIASIADLAHSGRDRSYDYDELGRLREAIGPFQQGYSTQTLCYEHDSIGNLTRLGGTPGTGCEGGRALQYPAPGPPRPHAPSAVDGSAPSYDPVGNLTSLDDRSYAHDALGRLVQADEAGQTLARFAYDAGGRRVRVEDVSGSRVVLRYLVTPDFEWDATRGVGRVHLSLGGSRLVTITDAYDGATAWIAPAALQAPRTWLLWAIGLPALLAAAALALQLLRLHRSGASLRRPALAGSTVIFFWLALAPRMPGAEPMDGDLNGDGRVDAADSLLALRMAIGSLAGTPGQQASGDVAPLGQVPPATPSVDAADVALLLRAMQGEDVDGDGLGPEAEALFGTSPFRADADDDGLDDGEELVLGTDPHQSDSDADGVSDGAELGLSDPLSTDTDGDGLGDAADPEPRAGMTFWHGDPQRSVLLVTGIDGSVIARPVYRPFGGIVGPGAVPAFGFTGQRHVQAVKVYDYGARWYDPGLGRFLEPDALVPEPLDPQSLNRYSYVRNDPVNRVDPTGRFDLGFGSIAPGFSHEPAPSSAPLIDAGDFLGAGAIGGGLGGVGAGASPFGTPTPYRRRSP